MNFGNGGRERITLLKRERVCMGNNVVGHFNLISGHDMYLQDMDVQYGIERKVLEMVCRDKGQIILC